jgi:16S rRNA (guanine966-N2)-methyltransferase
MRIIGGKYRGKKLISPSVDYIRPTSDKAREALFNILRSRLGCSFVGKTLIDVFAGSGAFALEALSQGFAEVTLVDKDISSLLKNTALFPVEQKNIHIVRADATQNIPCATTHDVAFLDAPYRQGLTEQALTILPRVLKPGALCLIEVEKNESCELPLSYRLLDERHYGLAKVLIAEFIS